MAGFGKGFADAFGQAGGMSMGGGLLGAAGNLISGGIGQIFAGANARREWRYKRKEMKLQQKYNRENMAIQNQYAIDAFNRENAYNDPSAVAGRYRQAGISPQMALGGGASGAGISGSMQTPDSEGPSGGGHYGSSAAVALQGMDLLQYKKTLQDIENSKRLTDADVDLKSAEADRLRGNDPNTTQDRAESKSREDLNRVLEALNAQKVLTEKQETRIKEVRAQLDESLAAVRYGEAWESYKKLQHENALLVEEVSRSKFLTERQKESYLADLNRTKAEAYEAWQRGAQAEADKALSEAKAKVAKLTEKEVEERTNYLVQQAKREMQKADFEKWEQELRKQFKDPRSRLEKWEARARIMRDIGSAAGNASAIIKLLITKGKSAPFEKKSSADIPETMEYWD